MDECRVRIEMLGGLRVTRGGRVLARFRTQKTAALLAYLALHPESAHPREVLTELFWPDAPPETGRLSLRVALNALRAQIDPPGARGSAVLVADRMTVGLNAAAVTTDVAEMVRAVRRAAHASTEEDRIRWLAAAADLYAGELLPGFYEDWVVGEQRRVAEMFHTAVAVLAAALERAGDRGRAVTYLRASVAADPLREEPRVLLMRLLARAGDRAAALREYRDFEERLSGELGVRPGRALTELARSIERGDLEPVVDAGVPSQTHAEPETRSAGGSRSTVTVLLLRLPPATAPDVAKCSEEVQAALGRASFRCVQEGDLWTAFFGSATDAVEAAAACLRALASRGVRGWRMALHTEDREPSGGAGPIAMGLLAAAGAEQALCGEEAAILTRRDLPGVRWRELGRFRITGSEQPMSLRSLELDDAPEGPAVLPDAPPAVIGVLPAETSQFFGRTQEVSRLKELLAPGSDGLVCITGPGGNGKTRLASEVARQLAPAYGGRVWFASLADVADGRVLAAAVRDAMGLPATPGDPLQQIAGALAGGPALLVLDNLEQVVEEAASLVVSLRERLPRLACLATSRQRLQVAGEQEVRLPPLPTPFAGAWRPGGQVSGGADPEALLTCPSVQLFVDRARAARPEFRLTAATARPVADLCERLEGVPLSIELAAARITVLSPAQMLRLLDRRLDFLVSRRRDIPERHRTLRAALEWSYALLAPGLRDLFGRLCVFRSGWTLEAAEAIAAGDPPLASNLMLDGLDALAEASLITFEDAGGSPRYRMLETVRQYAEEKLAESGGSPPYERHARYYASLAATHGPGVRGADAERCQRVLEAEHPNALAALLWCARQDDLPDGAALALGMVRDLWRFWEARGLWREGRSWIDEALCAQHGSDHDRGHALSSSGVLAYLLGDYDDARRRLAHALDLLRAAGDEAGAANALHGLGQVARFQGRYNEAEQRFRETLEAKRRAGDRMGESAALLSLALLAIERGDQESARPLLEQTLAIDREMGDRVGAAVSLVNLGFLALHGGEHERARALFEEGLAIRLEAGVRAGAAYARTGLGMTAVAMGDLETARAELREAYAVFSDIGSKRGLAMVLDGIAHLLASSDRLDDALALWSATARLQDEAGISLGVGERQARDERIDRVRAALGQRRFDAARRRGDRMDWAAAGELAATAWAALSPSADPLRA